MTMNAKETALWNRLHEYEFDAPIAVWTFARRLAREQGWSKPYGRRAIAEYRKFCFLAMAAGHSVTPPDAVDEVWHLHLIHSREYWERFCPLVLEGSLHHGPTRGGPAEQAKHLDWYARTLASYRRFFGAPPTDIWPELAERFSARNRHRRVNLRDVWIVSKRTIDRIAIGTGILVALASVGFAWPLLGNLNIFDWAGPDFLVLFVTLLAVGALCAAFVRSWLGTVSTKSHDPLGPCALAYLTGGRERVVDVAVCRLVEGGQLTFDAASERFAATPSRTDSDSKLERCILQVAAGTGEGVTMSVIRICCTDHLDDLEAWLIDNQFLLTAEGESMRRWLPALIMLAIVAIGAVKIVVGLNRHRPVGFLVALDAIGIFATAMLATRPARQSSLGAAAVMKQRNDWRAETGSSDKRDDLHLAFAVALLGTAAVSGTAVAMLKSVLTPPPSAGSSGWGSSGCGGGGCGGGGCGGGGCGGCSG